MEKKTENIETVKKVHWYFNAIISIFFILFVMMVGSESGISIFLIFSLMLLIMGIFTLVYYLAKNIADYKWLSLINISTFIIILLIGMGILGVLGLEQMSSSLLKIILIIIVSLNLLYGLYIKWKQ